jgi:putative nucleotidyltransferase with HDIG domain
VPCASLQQAVSRLGMHSIMEIALAVSVKSRMFQTRGYTDLLSGMWKHAIVTGLFTKEVARIRRQNVEIAFLAGLLHDIGKAVLLANLDRAHGAAGVRMDELVQALHEHHTAAGGMLAMEWRLPEQLGEAISCHHEFERASRFADMTMMVCLGDILSHMVVPMPDGPRFTCEAIQRHPVIEGLNLYPDQLEELTDRTQKIVSVAEAVG